MTKKSEGSILPIPLNILNISSRLALSHLVSRVVTFNDSNPVSSWSLNVVTISNKLCIFASVSPIPECISHKRICIIVPLPIWSYI